MDKPFEYWMALIASVSIVIARNNNRKLLSRAILGGISGMMATSLTPSIAQMTGIPEVFVMFIVGVAGYAAVDMFLSLLQDVDFVKEVIRKRLGGK